MIDFSKKLEEKLVANFAIGEVEIKVHSNVHLYGGTQCADISVYNLTKKENEVLSGTIYCTKKGTSCYGNSDEVKVSLKLGELLKEIINEELLYDQNSSFDGDDEFWADNHKIASAIFINGECFI